MGPHYTSSDSVQSISRSAVGFLSGTLLSRLTGLLRDMALAAAFGTHEALSAFFVALRFAHLGRRLFGEGLFQAAFIPLFEETRKVSPAYACRFFRDLSALWLVFLSVVAALSTGALYLWMKKGQLEPGAEEIALLTAFMVPSLVPICLFGLNISFLQCEGHYFAAGVAPAYFNLILTVSALGLSYYTPTQAMPFMALAVVGGCTAQWTASAVPVFRRCREVLQKQLFHNVNPFSATAMRIWKPLALSVLGVSASQINGVIDALFARATDSEGPAQLWFAIRFQQLPLALFGIAISNAVLPPLARAVQANDCAQYRSFIEDAMRKTLALLAPSSGALLVLGLASINCAYGHMHFHLDSIIKTTGCLHGYLIGLIPAGFISVLAPALYAKALYQIPMKGTFLSLLSNTLLNSLMVFVFGWQAMSIAVATSISAWLNAAYLYWHLRRKVGPLLSKKGFSACCSTLLVSALASLATYVFISLWDTPPLLFVELGHNRASVPGTFVGQAIQLALPACCFVATLGALASKMGAEDVSSLFAAIGHRVRRIRK